MSTTIVVAEPLVVEAVLELGLVSTTDVISSDDSVVENESSDSTSADSGAQPSMAISINAASV
ncbi:MAG TPA: hypothetical protein VE057_21570 [Archangium sp.]|nr:hypothetical protein [Archangium sp.]